MIAFLFSLILSNAQVTCLNLSYNYGEPYGLGKTFRAVVLVESSGCLHESGDKGKSVGASQIQVYTARQTCACDVDEEQLRGSRTLNLSIGAKFLARCFNQFWPDRNRALYCYSAGIPAASKATARQVMRSRYVKKVLEAEHALEQLPKDTK